MKPIRRAAVLVRDKDGNPKFKDEKTYKFFKDRLSNEDKQKVKEKYGWQP